MQKPTICLIGCGRTGQFLVDRLQSSWKLIVIEKDPEVATLLKTRYTGNDINIYEGDGSSAVVLQNSGIESAFQILITVSEDQVSTEIVHLLKTRFQKKQIIARITNLELAAQMRQEGIFVANPFDTMANLFVNQVNLGETIAVNIGKGEGEIVQIELTQSSPLVGKPLRDLPPRAWLIGAIYRPKKRLVLDSNMPYFRRLQISKEDELIIPKGNTVPKAGDKVILIGDPHILRATAQYLKAGAPVFPIRYGETVVCLFLEKERDPGAYREFKWLLYNMEPSHLLFLYQHDETRQTISRLRFPEPWVRAGKDRKDVYRISRQRTRQFIANSTHDDRIGLVVYREPLGFLRKIFDRIFFLRPLVETLRSSMVPFWIIRYRGPVHGVVLYVSADNGILQAAELAVDAALKFKLPLTTIQVNAPGIIAGSASQEQANNTMQAIHEIAALSGIRVHEITREGNPVFETLQVIRKEHLLVVSLPKESRAGFMIPNASRLLIKKFDGSVLFLAGRK